MPTHSARVLHEPEDELQAHAETDTDSERPACFKIVPTMFAVRLTPTLLRLRERFLARANLITISSSRCQTTRTPRPKTKRAETVFTDDKKSHRLDTRKW